MLLTKSQNWWQGHHMTKAIRNDFPHVVV